MLINSDELEEQNRKALWQAAQWLGDLVGMSVILVICWFFYIAL